MPVVSLLEAFIKFALRELIFCIRFVVHKHNDYEYQCISCDLTGTTGDGQQLLSVSFAGKQISHIVNATRRRSVFISKQCLL